ncbi:MAG: hypothetical protein QOF21_1529 [Actinomycetota bacterium]
MPDDVVVRARVEPFVSSGAIRRLGDMAHTAVARGDVVHITGDIHFVALTVAKRRCLVTVLDCGLAESPNRLARTIYRALWLRWPLRHAGRVVAISAFTAEQVAAFTGLPRQKIDVIPVSIDDTFTPVPSRDLTGTATVLCFNGGPNKNLRRSIEALRGMDVRLTIVGPVSDETRASLDGSGLSWMNGDRLTDDRLHQMYEEADVVLFPSTYEGFGMPIVEGQAIGRPVVTSDRAPMNEVAGGAACLVDPDDPQSIRAGVERVLGDADYRRDLIAKGYENRERFRPEVAARAYAEIYREMVATRRA